MSQIILYIMIIFSILGAIDKLFNNRLGYGEKFELGFKEMGGLSMTMVGIYCLSPVIAKCLMPILFPLSKLTKADASIFISSILACDMGGYTTAIKIAKNQELAKFSGLILASIMGSTVSFTIPIATNIISEEDFQYFAKGMLYGIATIPIGCLVGGFMMKLSIKEIIVNIIPIAVLSITIVICLIKIQDKIVNLFISIGKIIFIISIVGLILSILDFVLEIKIISDMIPFEEGIIIVAKIAVILSGAYSLIQFLSKILKNNLSKASERLRINETSILGLFMSLANSIPMLGIFEGMDSKGKIINAAFAVSGAFTFGGQLGFISSVSQDMVSPFIISKLIGGFSAILISVLFIKLEEKVTKVI